MKYPQLKSEKRRENAKQGVRFAIITDEVKQYIINHLGDWSPEQISGRMEIDLNQSISHQTLYDYINHDKANGDTLYKKLPHQGKKYKYGNPVKIKIKNRVDISKRSKIVEDKQRIGDFEGDTIVGVHGGGSVY